MKVVCFAKQKEKDSKFFCYPFIIPKKSLREERICGGFFIAENSSLLKLCDNCSIINYIACQSII